jgi:hypothetical protein
VRKSTTIKILCTCADPTPGSARVAGYDVRKQRDTVRLRQDLRAVGIVWHRELIRFKSDRLRAVTSLIQPVLFLFVLGTGPSTLAGKGMPPGISCKTFLYPASRESSFSPSPGRRLYPTIPFCFSP